MSISNINPVLKWDKNYHPLVFFVECKWIVKEKKTSRIINEDLGTYSDDFDEEISSDDFDEETSNESSCESDL